MRAHILERLAQQQPNLALLVYVTGDSITPEAEGHARMAHRWYRIAAEKLAAHEAAAPMPV